ARIPLSKKTIDEYLKTHFPDEKDRELMARLLNAMDFKGFTALARESEELNTRIAEYCRQRGLDPTKDVIYVVGVDDIEQKEGKAFRASAGSGALMSYVYGRANDIPGDRFASYPALKAMQERGELKGKLIVYLDDTIYSGNQVSTMLGTSLKDFREN